jgi:hypothetical protein
MKKEYRMLVIIALTVTMMMGISNMYGKAFADPAHCDIPGWPSCYKVGYDDGLGMSGSCPSGHSSEFCRGWDDATSGSNNNASGQALEQNASNQQVPQQNASNQQVPQQNASNQQVPQQNSTMASGTLTSGNTAWQEFGLFVGPIQRHTGVYHNENGVFIPWTTLCKAGQSYLNETCDSLINPGGSLSSEGDKAVGCITNGAILTAIASSFNISIDTIKGLLGFLAPHTGCGGIVKLDQIQTSPDLQRLMQFATSLAH